MDPSWPGVSCTSQSSIMNANSGISGATNRTLIGCLALESHSARGETLRIQN